MDAFSLRTFRMVIRRMSSGLLQCSCIHKSHMVVVLLAMPIVYLCFTHNILEYALALPFYFFQYPLDIDLSQVVDGVINGQQPTIDPINTARYPIILNDDRMCKTEDGDDEHVFLLLVIKSSMENFSKRDMIRKTWGSYDLVPYAPTRRIFLLGVRPGDDRLQQRIAQEHQQWQDIVQAYFVDTYFNNTAKLMMGFQWATTHCRGAKYLSFVDDDFFFSTYNAIKLLNSIPQAEVPHLVIGYVYRNAMPMRIKWSKWYISLSEYQYRFWPPYPTAGCFIISQDAAQRVFIGSHYVKSIRFDDVYIGLITWKLGMTLRNSDYIYESDVKRSVIRRQYKNIIGYHGLKDPDDLWKLWQEHRDLQRLMSH